MVASKAAADSRHPDLCDLLQGIYDGREDCRRPVTGLASDSRRVRPGDVFLACPGGRSHGLDHLDEAIHRGAGMVIYDAPGHQASLKLAALKPRMPAFLVPGLRDRMGLIAARYWGDPSARMTVIGVTGTNGKTSVSHYLAQVLEQQGRRCAVMGTLGSGFPEQLAAVAVSETGGPGTTPDALTIQETLAGLDADAVAMEVSSHGLDQGRVNGVHFDSAIFTNLSRDHLDYHGDMASYGRCKASLFQSPGLRQAVINADDAFAEELFGVLSPTLDAVACGLDGDKVRRMASAHGRRRVSARIVAQGLTGMRLEVDSDWGRATLSLALLGDFNASNALAVLGQLLLQGVSLAEACQAVSRLLPVPGRMECLPVHRGALVVVDYAHTPDALEKALQTLRQHCQGRLFCLFGCGGERDQGKRPLMGAVAERLADQVILSDDNPRYEDSQSILSDILAGMQRPQRVTVIADRGEAIAEAWRQLSANDVLLIAGKGHEGYQSIGGQMLNFDDRQRVRDLEQGGEAL